MFGYVIVAVMLLFVGDVVDNVIVGFVIFTVVIVFFLILHIHFLMRLLPGFLLDILCLVLDL